MCCDPVPVASPSDATAPTSRSTFNRQSRYLALGDRFDELLDDLDWDALDRFGATPAPLLRVLAMVTIFQFSEDLGDRQAVNSVRLRMDWKYALHLPADYPGFSPGALAEFRRRLDRNPDGRRLFQQVLVRMVRIGLLPYRVSVDTLLSTVDAVNCLEEVNEALLLALEALASGDPDRLRVVARPYWYNQYNPARYTVRIPHTDRERQVLLAALEADISSLLAAIVEDAPSLLEWPEVRALDRLWQDKFGRSNPR